MQNSSPVYIFHTIYWQFVIPYCPLVLLPVSAEAPQSLLQDVYFDLGPHSVVEQDLPRKRVNVSRESVSVEGSISSAGKETLELLLICQQSLLLLLVVPRLHASSER